MTTLSLDHQCQEGLERTYKNDEGKFNNPKNAHEIIMSYS